jgi:cell division protein ZapA
MGQVTLLINGYSYMVGCEDGQEQHLEAMGRQVQKRIDGIRALGQTGEARLLVLVSLLMADELHDKDAALSTARSAAPAPPPPAGPDPEVSDAIRRLAEKAEDIAATLERA